MPRYRIAAEPNWATGCKVELGVIEAETIEEAEDEAFDKAAERLSVWAELIPEDEQKES